MIARLRECCESAYGAPRVPCILDTCKRQVAREANSLAVPRWPTGLRVAFRTGRRPGDRYVISRSGEPRCTRSRARGGGGRRRKGSRSRSTSTGRCIPSVSLARDSRLPGTPANEDAGWVWSTSPALGWETFGRYEPGPLLRPQPRRPGIPTDLAHPGQARVSVHGQMGWDLMARGQSMCAAAALHSNRTRAVLVVAGASHALPSLVPISTSLADL